MSNETEKVEETIHNLRGQVIALERVIQSLQQKLFERNESSSISARSKMAFRNLTFRQNAVLQLIIKGKSNKEIADIIGSTEGTVKSHVRGLFAKLNVSDRAKLIAKVSPYWEAVSSDDYFSETDLEKHWTESPKDDLKILKALQGRRPI